MKTLPDIKDIDLYSYKFASRIRIGEITQCWNWVAGLEPSGYGYFWINNNHYRTNRVAYKLFKREDPEHLHVCHTCDNPKCCNPTHLYLGNPKLNAADRVRRGRQSHVRPKPKLTEQQVKEIKIRLGFGGSQALLAREFGVSKSAIVMIKRGTNWKTVNP